MNANEARKLSETFFSKELTVVQQKIIQMEKVIEAEARRGMLRTETGMLFSGLTENGKHKIRDHFFMNGFSFESLKTGTNEMTEYISWEEK
jgi:hypothetical protein